MLLPSLFFITKQSNKVSRDRTRSTKSLSAADSRVMNRNWIIGMSWRPLTAILFVLPASYSKGATLDDLKKLEIICFVPSHLPDGFRLKKVQITYDEIREYEDKNRPLPLYSLEYGDNGNRTF